MSDQPTRREITAAVRAELAGAREQRSPGFDAFAQAVADLVDGNAAWARAHAIASARQQALDLRLRHTRKMAAKAAAEVVRALCELPEDALPMPRAALWDWAHTGAAIAYTGHRTGPSRRERRARAVLQLAGLWLAHFGKLPCAGGKSRFPHLVQAVLPMMEPGTTASANTIRGILGARAEEAATHASLHRAELMRRARQKVAQNGG